MIIFYWLFQYISSLYFENSQFDVSGGLVYLYKTRLPTNTSETQARKPDGEDHGVIGLGLMQDPLESGLAGGVLSVGQQNDRLPSFDLPDLAIGGV